MEFVTHAAGKLAYRSLGSGSETWIFFHGFGQRHQDMLAFDQLRTPTQRYLFVDLVYHGQSSWNTSQKELKKEDWKAILLLLLQKEGIDTFHLVGYSMGGKFALLSYELLPERISSLSLLAPDGIKTGLWYSMSNYPSGIHPLFKQVVFRPQRFFTLVDGLKTAGLLQKSLVKFVKTQLETRSKRAQAYLVWKVLGGLHLQLGTIIRQLRQRPIPVTVVLGEFDRMVSPKNLERFITKVPDLKLLQLPVGHGQLIEATVSSLLQTQEKEPYTSLQPTTENQLK
jgi:pimeloyl-ACP methyl ester carboxylesterase